MLRMHYLALLLCFSGSGWFRLVSAHPHPGESHPAGSGGERSAGPSSNRIRKNRSLCGATDPKNPHVQTGDVWLLLIYTKFILSLNDRNKCNLLSLMLNVCCEQTVREQAIRALVLVPTKELGQQVQTMIRQLTAYCGRDVRVADISGKADLSAQKSVLQQITLFIKSLDWAYLLKGLYLYMELNLI